MPSFDGEVSESEVLSMFDKDGDLREEPQGVDEESAEEGQDAEDQDEEETEAEGEESEEEEEPEEEESEEDDEAEEEAEPELDWSKVAPEHKAAFDASQKEVSKLRKDYGKIQSKLHELSLAAKDQPTQEVRQQAEMASQWNSILEQHPELEAKIVDLIKQAQNPESSIPEHLREDPAVQFMLEQNRRLENQLKQLGEQTKPLDEWKAEKQTAANRQKLEGLLGEAAEEYKSMFGKDMDEEAKTAVLKFMVEKKYYESGSNAALTVFGPQYKKALSAKETSRLREKAAKFGGRTKGVNPRRATSEPKINSERDAISQALRDQGLEF